MYLVQRLLRLRDAERFWMQCCELTSYIDSSIPRMRVRQKISRLRAIPHPMPFGSRGRVRHQSVRSLGPVAMNHQCVLCSSALAKTKALPNCWVIVHDSSSAFLVGRGDGFGIQGRPPIESRGDYAFLRNVHQPMTRLRTVRFTNANPHRPPIGTTPTFASKLVCS